MNEAPTSSSLPNCPSCGTLNPWNARFCVNCGTRLVDDATLERAFESSVADVVSDASPQPAASSASSDPGVPDAQPASTAPLVDAVQPSLSASQPVDALGWPAGAATPPAKTNKTALFVILGILAVILLCCCAFGLIAIISAANDTGLQHTLSPSA
jgi:hypothetical protein